MTSFQTYYSTASHFRHPWFDTTVMKRKQPIPLNPSEDMDDEDESDERSTKRRRCTTMLEAGIAHLSLNNGESGIVEEEDSPTSPAASEASSTSSGDRQNVVLPESVEEPLAPEVKMGTSSWYEPERDRIVITDLDSYAEEEEEVNAVDVNSAFLNQLRQRRMARQHLPIPETRALVIFQPLSLKRQDDGDAMELDT